MLALTSLGDGGYMERQAVETLSPQVAFGHGVLSPCWAVVVHAFNHSTQEVEAEAGRSL